MPPTSPAAVETKTTAARFICPWLAATPAAPTAAAPMPGTPAHDAMTARNSSGYAHQLPATPVARITLARGPVPKLVETTRG